LIKQQDVPKGEKIPTLGIMQMDGISLYLLQKNMFPVTLSSPFLLSMIWLSFWNVSSHSWNTYRN